MHLLNRHVLYETLQEKGINVRHHRKGVEKDYTGCRYLTENTVEDPEYLYICPYENRLTAKSSDALYCGPWKEEDLPSDTDYFLCKDLPERQLVNLMEEVFSEYRSMEERVRLAQASVSPLFELCEAIAAYFHVAVFFHDEHFLLRAYDRRLDLDDHPAFVYSSQYKTYVQAPSVLDDFRVNPEYRRTLKTQGVQFWVDPTSDHCCIYANQFYMNRYLGRLIIEKESFTPGLAHAAEYFSSAIHSALSQELVSGTATDPISFLLRSYAEKEVITKEAAANAAASAGWPENGRYVASTIRFYKNQINAYMIYGICTSIQNILPGCRMYHRGNRIYMLINLEIGNLTPADIRMKLAEQIRESLLKASLSDTFHELSDFPMYMQQAVVCLDYIVENQKTEWFCEYRQVAASVWLRKGSGILPEDVLIAPGLRELQHFDSENGSALYETLKAYIVNERSPVATSKALHIHRSTLPHRLEKIQELTGYNLNSARTRLHLLMSFLYLNEKRQ